MIKRCPLCRCKGIIFAEHKAKGGNFVFSCMCRYKRFVGVYAQWSKAHEILYTPDYLIPIGPSKGGK